MFDYHAFLNTPNRGHWERFGLARRAGVCVPLFSVFSRESIGIGEIPDLKLLIDWCGKTGMSLVQLLPMNDVGFSFTPYDAQSSFALDPMYLALGELQGVQTASFREAFEILRKKFPAGKPRVNYEVKRAKLDLLWKIFQSLGGIFPPGFQHFVRLQKYWLQDYAFFKVIKEGYQEAGWMDWPQALDFIQSEHSARLLFYQWLQWQLFEQFLDVKQYAAEKKVYLMGDIPFLVSRDSADVWAHQNYFKLHLSSGAPPDAFFAKGQRWGMPPYDWPVIEACGHDYLKEKIKYARHFYDLFRIDHVVGTFRLWTIELSEPAQNHGLNGRFDPENQGLWEEHGRRLLTVMSESAPMLPCAEDLGVIPDCCPKTLWDLAIPGMEVQRWTKEWHRDAEFKKPEDYRPNAITVISNHDTTSFAGWWTFEAGTVDEELFGRLCGERGLDARGLKEKLFDLSRSFHGRLRWKESVNGPEVLAQLLERPWDQAAVFAELHKGSFHEKEKFWEYAGLQGPCEELPSARLILAAMEKASQSRSIFCIQLLQDLLDLGPLFEHDAWEFRINFPGSCGPQNWSLVIPIGLEKLLRSRVNLKIKRVNELGGRI